jgi:pimeloyl-ACP methyl ester carboxylesterase
MTAFVDRHWTSADGLRLYARDYAAAAGPAKLPVIAIHGLTRNSADFEAIAPLIAQSGRRVLAVDVRGRGRSDRAPDPMTYQPAVYAKDVLELLRQAGIERAVFLGTSMGGLITMALAAIRSKVIAAAIINDVGPEVAKEGLARIA